MIKSFFIKLLKPLTLIAFFIIYSCGTTSSLSSKQGSNSLDLSIYENIVVDVFTDKTKKSNVPNYFLENFQEKIISWIRGKNVFDSVENKIVDSTNINKTLVVKGSVTRYSEGNPALRLMIGFGAGSSYLDANIYLINASTNGQIGAIEVDKNSWAFGGAIASSQTVETFMRGAALKIAKELEKSKLNKNN